MPAIFCANIFFSQVNYFMDIQGGGTLERKEALFIIVACVGGMGAAF